MLLRKSANFRIKARELLFIVFLIISSSLMGNTYYVSPTGSDAAAGTLSAPWKTWGKAFTSASPGDTVYFRGGVYPMTVSGGAGYRSINDGTAGNLIYYWAYPSDFAAGNKPILDCGAVTPSSSLHHGIYATANFCHFKGLTIRNVLGKLPADECLGWRMTGNNSIIELCTVYNTHGFGFRDEASTNMRYINCDTYNNCDILRTDYPGNDGYGFAAWNTSNTTGSVYYYGCRAWDCGDDGFVFYSKSYVEVNNCWSFTNGMMEGGGHGFKLGFLPPAPYATLLRKVTNSLAVYNRAAGFTTNDNNVESISCNIYNNTAYHNGYFSGWTSPVYGFYFYNTTSANDGELKRIFKNNISYDNEDGHTYVATNALYTHDHNTWDIPVTLSAADFESLDSTGISGPRQIDGSLPDLKGFLKQKSTSNTVDAGVNVGLPYVNGAPDLGAYELVSGSAPVIPAYVSSAIANATPSILEVTYNSTLANIVPAASAFNVMVNSVARTVSSVSISGTKVLLTLSSPVVNGNIVTVAYTKPATNPLQTASGGQAASITARSVTNNVAASIPAYVSSAIANATPSVLEVTYNSTLANIVPAASAFSVMVNSVARTVSSVSISGTKVLLTLSSPVVNGNIVTVAYTKPATNPLQTASGGQAASITARSVTNNVAASIPAYVSSAIANATPSVLEVTYNSTLANIVPAASAFSVMVNSVARTVSSVSISGTKVLLTLASPVVNGNIVTVAYTKPATNPLQTASGGQAVSVTAQPVTNNVAASIPAYVSSAIANATPSVLEVTYNSTLANIVPAASAFSVMVNSVARTVSSVSISGTKVLLTLSSPVVNGNIVTVAYTKPATNPLQTASGGQAASITARSVTNNVAASIPAYVSSAIANATPSILEVTYNSTLANIVPAASAFSVMVNSVARTVSSVSISGTKVLLTLSSPVVNGNIVTVAYTKPATNPLQTASGGQAASISAQPVTNNLTAALTGTRYYVARNGSDSNNGAIGTPWATWGKAFASTTAGDTVFFRGGVYPHTVTDGNGYTTVGGGSAGKITVYMAYPGEVPILDCSNVNPTVATVRALNASLNYIKFKGLVIRNLRQPSINHEVVAVMSTNISNTTFENCAVYNIGGVAFQPWNPVNVHYINCDAYNCSDPYGHQSGSVPGGRGTGFSMITQVNQSSTLYYKNCRAWKCSDKGFAMLSVGYVEADGCWAFNNGLMQGGGDGFKVSFNITTSVPLARKITRCIAAYNKSSGFTTNDNQSKAIPMIHANNIAYRNAYGFFVYNTATSDALERSRKFQNNISYDNTTTPVFVATNALYTHSYNSWDHSPAVTVSKGDFVSVDSTGLAGPRQPDGSLPDLNFLKLATGSDLINAGTNVGLPYNGSAPDLGAFEKASGSSARSTKRAPVISFIEPYDGEHFVASGKIDVSIDSYDPDTLISKVEYLIGDTRIGESHQAPYSISFDSPASGSHRITSNAYDELNEIVYSSSIDVYVDEGTGPIILYPNPNDGHFSIESLIPLQNKGGVVNIVNSTGQTVYQGTWENEENIRQFNLSHLDPGIYILIIKSQGILFTKKFIKK